mgnify:CR=1 FL=1
MIDKFKALQETLENHVSQLKGTLSQLESDAESVKQRISHTEGRVFELKEVIEFFESQEVTDASTGERKDDSGSGAGTEV